MNFVFYDTETTGLDVTFDQILQFAAILTDADLNELDRFEGRCRIQPHIIPSVEALLATRVTPKMLTDPQLPSHYQLMHKIAEKLNSWSPATFLGYNTINFDEPLLRQAFYQTLHPPYLTNTNGNQRGDVFRFVQTIALLRPELINIPKNKLGKHTLRLDMLAPYNGFAHENAHEALSDVEATIYIANLIRERFPELWSTMMPLVAKSEIIHRTDNHKINCLIEFFGMMPSIRAIVRCGEPVVESSLITVFDLSYDPENYIHLSVDELVKVMNGPRKAIRTIYINRMPAILPFECVKHPKNRFNISLSEIKERAICVNKAKQFHEKVYYALKKRFPKKEPSKIVEERIYESFPNNNDQELMKRFHSAPTNQQYMIVNSFEDDRLKEIGQRLLFLENPTVLEADIRSKLEKWKNNRKNGREGVSSGRTLHEVFSGIDELLKKMPERKSEINEIKNWFKSELTD
ncbi:MAG: hypothetical protein H6627_15045 [Calditrichae bacterium]|nr:hypothetical protein [Calditrichia bacterium]